MTIMTDPRFLQIHFLASYPGALLNRDDAGLAKRLPFGSATRTRVSSQCLKRHWRMADDAKAIHHLAKTHGVESERSKETIERLVTRSLRGTYDDDIVDAVETAFIEGIYGGKAKDKKSRQALLLGRPEIDWLAGEAETIVKGAPDAKSAKETATQFFKEEKKNLASLREANSLAAGLESALFGRMVTSDPKANRDAAVHVAHAFTVHDEQPELDYFTVVDDLTGHSEENEEGGTGAAGVFDTELTSGLYYGYVVIDIPLLVSNLTGEKRAAWRNESTNRELAAQVVENFIHLVATITPGAKKGSTAPYSYADLVMIEFGERQPRTLANAFQDPVALRGNGTLIERTMAAMQTELDGVDRMYGEHELRLLASRQAQGFNNIDSIDLNDLASRAGKVILTASV